MPRKINTKTQFGIVVGTKKVKTNKNMPQEDRVFFTPAELAVIDSGEMAVEDILWSSELTQANNEEVIDEDIDKCFLDTGKPGSKERIDALTEHYATKGETSPFVTSDDETADGLIRWFAQQKLNIAAKKRGEKASIPHTPIDKAMFNMILSLADDVSRNNLED